MKISFKRVSSRKVLAIAYNQNVLLPVRKGVPQPPPANFLFVQYVNKAVYAFMGVPEETYNNLLEVDSVGTTLHELVEKDAPYPYFELDPTTSQFFPKDPNAPRKKKGDK